MRRTEAMREVKNQKIRREIAKRGLCLYEIAEIIGINPTTFQVWIRTELTPARKAKVQAALDRFDADNTTKKDVANG